MKSSKLGSRSVQKQTTAPVSTRASERREANEKTEQTTQSSTKQVVAKDGFETGHLTQSQISAAAISGAKLDSQGDLNELREQGTDRVSQQGNVIQAIETKTQSMNAQFAELKAQS